MNKNEFLTQLRKKLSSLPQNDIDEHLTFYAEMIDDRMEDGLPEADAVSQMGNVDEIAAQIISDTPLVKIATERIKPDRCLRAWEIILLVLGSPVWLSLIIAAAAVIFALYISVWAIIVALWSVFAALLICSFGCIATSIFVAFHVNFYTGIALFAAGLICGGLSIFLFFGFSAATKGILAFTKKFAVWVKNRFIKKEDAQ